MRTPDLPPLKPEAAHSARLFSAHRRALLALSYTVAKNRDPWLSRFWMLAVAEWLPVERRMLKCCRPGAAFRGHSCKLCDAEVETVRHVFVCPHPGLVDSRADSVGGALSVLHAAGIRSRTGMTSCPQLTQRVRSDPKIGSMWYTGSRRGSTCPADRGWRYAHLRMSTPWIVRRYAWTPLQRSWG